MMKRNRITFLADDGFKATLEKEATRKNMSVSELIRSKFDESLLSDEIMLRELIKEANTSSKRAHKAIDKGLADMSNALAQINRKNTQRA